MIKKQTTESTEKQQVKNLKELFTTKDTKK